MVFKYVFEYNFYIKQKALDYKSSMGFIKINLNDTMRVLLNNIIKGNCTTNIYKRSNMVYLAKSFKSFC